MSTDEHENLDSGSHLAYVNLVKQTTDLHQSLLSFKKKNAIKKYQSFMAQPEEQAGCFRLRYVCFPVAFSLKLLRQMNEYPAFRHFYIFISNQDSWINLSKVHTNDRF